MQDPFRQFEAWFAEAQVHEVNDANACALATAEIGPDGRPRPDVRIVLLKAVEDGGFVFFTNHQSAKGRQLQAAGHAALDFHWKSMRRQVRVRGPVAHIGAAASDAYFATRPRESRLSAWASLQSQPLDHRSTFEARLADMAARYPGEVPRPPHWGGWRLSPEEIEFWEDRPGRQHVRELFTKDAGGWALTLLYP